MTQQKQNKFSRRHATWVCHGETTNNTTNYMSNNTSIMRFTSIW